uniref:Uncharacterized protein n=1 Tax=Rhizophora mucronata TaxID=61149 RepID=A0A2P2P5M9_RHIMU
MKENPIFYLAYPMYVINFSQPTQFTGSNKPK